MSIQNIPQEQSNSAVERLIYWLGLLLVLIGMLNVTPTIPGWDEIWKSLTGLDTFKIRRFSTEWLYPIVFTWMMLIVALKHSMWRSWADKTPIRRRFGLLMDFVLVFSAAIISASYLIEIESVCLLDMITGDRARLVALTLQADIEYAELLGLPIPETADDPACLTRQALCCL